MNSDFYAILGVAKDSSQVEVKAAYVRLSKALHPDVNPHGATLMQAVNEAYEVLGDAKKRAAYDRGEKVREFPKASTFDGGAVPIPGTIDLTKLAQAFVPPSIYAGVGPALEQALKDRGIKPEAANVVNVLQQFGLLKKRRARKSA